MNGGPGHEAPWRRIGRWHWRVPSATKRGATLRSLLGLPLENPAPSDMFGGRFGECKRIGRNCEFLSLLVPFYAESQIRCIAFSASPLRDHSGRWAAGNASSKSLFYVRRR